MRWLAVILVLSTLTGCINRRYPPGVAVDPQNILKLGSDGDVWAVQREISNAQLTPTN